MTNVAKMITSVIHSGKRRKCWLLAFSPFPAMFQKPFLSQPLPNDKFLDWSRLKAFANDKMNVT